jgi:hypothetical protein
LISDDDNDVLDDTDEEEENEPNTVGVVALVVDVVILDDDDDSDVASLDAEDDVTEDNDEAEKDDVADESVADARIDGALDDDDVTTSLDNDPDDGGGADDGGAGVNDGDEPVAVVVDDVLPPSSINGIVANVVGDVDVVVVAGPVAGSIAGEFVGAVIGRVIGDAGGCGREYIPLTTGAPAVGVVVADGVEVAREDDTRGDVVSGSDVGDLISSPSGDEGPELRDGDNERPVCTGLELPNTPITERAKSFPNFRKKPLPLLPLLLPLLPGLGLPVPLPLVGPCTVANGGNGNPDERNRNIIARSSSAFRTTLRCSPTPLLNRL